MSPRALRNGVLGIAAVALAVWSFFQLFERRAVEVYVGYSREALSNPYLALEQLLEAMGHPVVQLDGIGSLDELPPTDALLVLPTPRRTLSRARQERLIDWVESGGRLVAVTYTLWDAPERRPDWLLDRFDLRQRQREDLEALEEEPEEEEAAGEASPPPPRGVAQAEGSWDPTRVYWPGLDEPLEVLFDPRFYWDDPFLDADLYVSGEFGTHLILLSHGRGWIAALTDDWFLRNGHIGEADHAEVAVRLARRGGMGAPVWIVTSEAWPGLFAQARRHALPALSAGGLLLLGFLWRASRRFGPLRPAPAPERRSWIEHLDAVGRFDWRHTRGRTLLAGARARVARAIQREHPLWARLDAPARAQQIAHHCGLEEAAVRRALDEGFHPTGDATFVENVACLERIRSSL